MVKPRRLATGLGFAAAVGATALLNRSSAAFEIADGVSLLYPGAIVAVLAGVLLGWWGVAATFLGVALTPWGLATTLPRALFFAATASLQAAVPAAMALSPRGTTVQRTLRMVIGCALANTLLSALIGIAGIRYLSGTVADGQLLLSFTAWFLGDATAVVLVALPVLVLARPGLFLEPAHRAMLRRWLTSWPLHGALLATLVVVVAAMEWLVPHGVSIHWLGLLLIVPVLVAAVSGSVGGGLVVTGTVGIVYVIEVLRLVRPEGEAALFRELLSSYLNLLAFALTAVVAGLVAARRFSLVSELDDHRRALQRSFEGIVTALAAAIEAKDPMTQGHVQRVADLAVRTARILGLDEERVELLRYAALLHDVGKIGVPESVLNKRGVLSADERAQLDRHVDIGVNIIASVDILAPAVPFIRYHQERWDGEADRNRTRYAGYYGLLGASIPLEARIIAAVDAFDAMTSDRPYRRAKGVSEGLAELRREAGRQFDPEVVDALVEAVESSALEPHAVHEAAS